jgi:hypothetical protein
VTRPGCDHATLLLRVRPIDLAQGKIPRVDFPSIER